MKKTILIVLLISLFVLAIPVAAETEEPVGERINVFLRTPKTFPADTPFHIRHGYWLWPPYDSANGLWDFDLEVDGVYQKEDYVDRWVDPYHGETPDIYRHWVHNFPEGLPAGKHTFVGRWYAPCKVAESWGLPPCSNQNELVFLDWEIELKVNFK